MYQNRICKIGIQNILLVILLAIITVEQGFSQDSIINKIEIDPSKPTNLYTQVNANTEFQFSNQQNLYGVRMNVQYAFNPDNLVLADLPFLYNDRTNKFGPGDLHVRYYTVIKRNISKSLIAIAPFVDLSIPMGSYQNGLGSSSLSVAAGVVFGFVLSKQFSLFPGISYLHISKQSTDIIAEDSKFSSDGIGFQINGSYRFNKRTFMFFNPTPTFLNINGIWQTIWSGDLNVNRIIIPGKFKMNIGWSPNFTSKIDIVRLGATLYLR